MTRTDEPQHLREENRSKTEIINLLSENISLGNKEVKEVLPHKENTFIESSRKHSFKANKRFRNQKTGNNLVLQNCFETLDVESNFTAHGLPKRRETLNISNPSSNANNSMNKNFSNKLNSTRRRPQVVINQNPESNDNYRKSKLYLDINYTVRQENITPQRQTIITLQFLVTVSQNLVENVYMTLIEILFLEEQD